MDLPPVIAGKGIANPVGQIWSGAMMLEYLGEIEASKNILNAIESSLIDKNNLAPDLGGTGTTSNLGDKVLLKL